MSQIRLKFDSFYFWSNRPAYFTFYDFFTLLITFDREYNHVLTSLRVTELFWHCITVAVFLKIKKPVIGITTNSQDLVRLAEVGLDLYSYGFWSLFSTFTMPIFCGVHGLSLLWTFLYSYGVALRLHLNSFNF